MVLSCKNSAFFSCVPWLFYILLLHARVKKKKKLIPAVLPIYSLLFWKQHFEVPYFTIFTDVTPYHSILCFLVLPKIIFSTWNAAKEENFIIIEVIKRMLVYLFF